MSRRGGGRGEGDGGEPTEAPTAHRLAEARRRGEVAYSRELSGAVALAAGVGVLLAFGPAGTRQLAAYFVLALARATAGGSPALAAGLAWDSAVKVLALPLAVAFLAPAGAGLLQTGGLWRAPGPLRAGAGPSTPGAARGHLFGGEAAREALSGAVKIALVAAVAWLTVRPLAPALAALTGASAGRVLSGLGALAARLALRVTVATLMLGAADYLMVRARHRRALRMTRQEVKRERRETEGDPAQRAERRRLHREVGELRSLEDVRRAALVVTGFARTAIALGYERDGPTAPLIVARGDGPRAERIEQLAREAGVPVFERETLARALAALEEGDGDGDEIPPALYEAVAELLKTVYRSAGGEAALE